MSLSLPWLVLIFFAVISGVFALVYEIRSKFIWKEKAFQLEKEIDKLKRQVSDPQNLQKAYNSTLQRINKKLTDRQFEIFLLVIDGLSSKEIGEKLNVSSSTIDSHIKEIITQLSVEKRSQFAGVLLGELKSSLSS
ncbi:MAG: HTH domain-containing protein [Ignavibacteriae bacterium]|nr:HTH domain-containing protein [Ignavibacteriota bacterium]